MTTTIITGTTIHSTVTLGSGNYASPLTITSTGGIDPTTSTGASALLINNPGTVTNSGVITGDAGFNDSGFNNTNPGGAGGTGVVMSTGSFTNNKQITGGKGGEISNFFSTASSKDGAGGAGLTLSGGSFTNAGTITGGAGGTGNLHGDNGIGGAASGGTGGYGVLISGGTLINTGSIAGGAGGAGYLGGNAGAAGAAVSIAAGLFIDSGKVNGSVVFGTGAATLEVESGASFSTGVSAGADTSAILELGGTTPFALTGIGTSFINFTTLAFAAGATGTLAGNSAGLAASQLIEGFTFGDNITLTGFAATSDSFASANNLVLKNSGGSTETIDLVGFTSTGQLRLANDGSNTTLTAVVSTISTAVTNAVTLGAGTYANAVSITNTGAVTGPAGAAGVYSANGNSTASGTAGSIAVLLNAASDTLTNSGVVTGGAGGAAANAPGGGSLNGGNGGAGGAGVALSAAGLLVNAGNIAGGAGGVYGYGGASGGSSGKSGTGGAGVSAASGAAIINSGNITGAAGLNINRFGGTQQGAAGVSLAGAGSISNSSTGIIAGGHGGNNSAVTTYYYNGFLHKHHFNYPGASGNGGTGLFSGAGETILNQGQIIGGTGGSGQGGQAGSGGVGLYAATGVNITNNGAITGGNGARSYYRSFDDRPGTGGAGVLLNGATLTNAGVITGGYNGSAAASGSNYSSTRADAVDFGSLAATLIIDSGAVFNGSIVANATVADVLEFAGSSTTKFSGIGTSAENFNHISFAAGAAWTIEGNATGLAASAETIAGFTSTDAIILDSFAAISETLNAGKLTLGNGSSFDTLNLGASTDNVVVQSNGTNSTILAAPASLSLATGTYILTGHSAGLTGSSITGFAAGDTIDLEGFSATSETYKSGIGLVLGNGTSFDTLHVNSFSGFFLETTDGTNTTIVAKPLVSIISTHVGAVGGRYSYVTLGNGTYADSLTITSSGVVGHPFGATDISDTAGQTGITLVNQGQINNADFGVSFVNAAYINNSGTIATNLGISLQNGGTIVNTGKIEGSQFGYSVRLKGGTIINAGYIGGNDAIYSSQALTLIEEPGQSSSNESGVRVGSGDGTVIFAAGTSSQDISSFKGFSNISFATNAAWTIDIQPSQNNFDGVTLTGFNAGNTIDLKNFTVESDNFANNVLTVTGQNGGYLFNIAGNFTTANFTFTNDGDFGTDLSLCYLRGTNILTPFGEVPVEELDIGDYVITRFSRAQKIKWIGCQSFSPHFIARNPAKRPIRIAAGALGDNLPERDLGVSPGHAILIGTQLVLASSLLNGITIRQETATSQVDYFNLELDTHDCVCADGAWCETYADGPGLRANFHNADEFWTLYPAYQTPDEIQLCAPRPLAGPALAAALRAPTARAAATITPGPLDGFIDIITPNQITGWARDLAHPHLPVELDVMLGDTLLTTILACDPRDDLDALGYGAHAFSRQISPPLSRAELSILQIRRTADSATLSFAQARAA